MSLNNYSLFILHLFLNIYEQNIEQYCRISLPKLLPKFIRGREKSRKVIFTAI